MPTFLEHDAGQPPGREGARIDVDAVLQNLWRAHWRVPVHDDPAEVRGAVEKLVADPEKVVLALCL